MAELRIVIPVVGLDRSGRTIIPGLIDAHAHGSRGVDATTPQNRLTFGVSTVQDPSNNTTEVFSASDVQRTGRILAPCTVSTGDFVYGALALFC